MRHGSLDHTESVHLATKTTHIRIPGVTGMGNGEGFCSNQGRSQGPQLTVKAVYTVAPTPSLYPKEWRESILVLLQCQCLNLRSI